MSAEVYSAPQFIIDEMQLQENGYLSLETSVLVAGEKSNVPINLLLGDPRRKFLIEGLGDSFEVYEYESQQRTYKINVANRILAIKKPMPEQRITLTCLNCVSETDPHFQEPSKTITVNLQKIFPVIKTNSRSAAAETNRILKEIDDEKQSRIDEERRQEKAKVLAQKQLEAKIAREGDGSPDDLACKRYGLKPGTSGYASCRIQIDGIRQQSQQQALQEQRRYETELLRYEEQRLAQKKEQSRQQGLKLLELSGRILSGQPSGGTASSSVYAAPSPPQIINNTIRMPDGSIMRCNTVGGNTTCY